MRLTKEEEVKEVNKKFSEVSKKYVKDISKK